MKKNIGLFIGLSMLFIGSFAYGASCSEIQNSTEVGNECYCNEGFNWNNSKTGCIAIDTSSRDTKLKEAIKRMYDNGLTQYDTPDKFKSNDYLTREQAAKFFVTFYSKVLNKKLNENVNLKIFSDMDKADPNLKYYIFQSYDMGLFKGVKGNFMPNNKLTQAQAISVAIRMMNGDLEEMKNVWFANYYAKAKKYGLLKRGNFDFVYLDKTNITRGDTALILYTLYDYITNGKEAAINYNYKLTTSINKCLDAEDKNIGAFESGTKEEMNNAINEILNACKEATKEIYNIGAIEENDSLWRAMLAVTTNNISFYNKAKEIVPYKRLENMTKVQETESDKISDVLHGLIEKFDESFENLKAIQKGFANDYGFSIEE